MLTKAADVFPHLFQKWMESIVCLSFLSILLILIQFFLKIVGDFFIFFFHSKLSNFVIQTVVKREVPRFLKSNKCWKLFSQNLREPVLCCSAELQRTTNHWFLFYDSEVRIWTWIVATNLNKDNVKWIELQWAYFRKLIRSSRGIAFSPETILRPEP